MTLPVGMTCASGFWVNATQPKESLRLKRCICKLDDTKASIIFSVYMCAKAFAGK
jgi:hypothetical protein